MATASNRESCKHKATSDRFNQWCENRKIDETLVIEYFKILSKNYAPATLWTYYSRLRLTINQTQKIDISKYTQLIRFLKENAKGFQHKQHKTFTRSEIATFLQEADDSKYLLIKALAICGLFGALNREELANMKWKHVRDKEEVIEIEVPCTNTSTSRLFTIPNASNAKVDMLGILRRYIKVRPESKLDSFFLMYKGKCIPTTAGINTIGAAPKMIAEFLKLPDPEQYTSNSFRRTAEYLALDSWRRRRHNFSLNPKALMDTCRFCLGAGRAVVDLFAPFKSSKDLIKTIEKMTETKIEDNSKWPRKICSKCLTTINKYGKFCQMIKASQEAIRNRNETPPVQHELFEIDTTEESAESSIIIEDTIETTMSFKEEPLDEDYYDEFDEYIITEPVSDSEDPQIKTEMPEYIDFEPSDDYVISITEPVFEEPQIKTEPPESQPTTSITPITHTTLPRGLSLKCKMCPRQQFLTIKELNKHTRKFHSLKKQTSSLQCDMCPKGQFSTINELQEHVRKVHGPKKNSQYRGLLFPDRQTSNKYKLVIQGLPKPNIEERLRSLESSSCSEHQHQQKKIRLEMTLNK